METSSRISRRKGGKAENKIAKVMHEFKEGKLKSSSGEKVTDRQQAIAIGLSEARTIDPNYQMSKKWSGGEMAGGGNINGFFSNDGKTFINVAVGKSSPNRKGEVIKIEERGGIKWATVKFRDFQEDIRFEDDSMKDGATVSPRKTRRMVKGGVMEIKNYYLPRKNKDRLKEELDYEENNLKVLLDMKNQSPIIKKDIEQTEHTIARIKERLNKKSSGDSTMAGGGSIEVSELSTRLGMRKEAVQKWLDKNGLSKEDALKILTGLGRKHLSVGDVSTAIIGDENNTYSKELIKYIKSDKAYSMAKAGVVKNKYEFYNGDVVWDIGNKSYGVVLHNFDNPSEGERGDIRLDSDGMQSIFAHDEKFEKRVGYNLVPYGSKEDKGDGDLSKLKASAKRLIDSNKDWSTERYKEYSLIYCRLLSGEFDEKKSSGGSAMEEAGQVPENLVEKLFIIVDKTGKQYLEDFINTEAAESALDDMKAGAKHRGKEGLYDELFIKEKEVLQTTPENLVEKLKDKYGAQIQDMGITEIFIDPFGEVHITSEHDIDPSWAEAIEADARAMSGSSEENASSNGSQNVATLISFADSNSKLSDEKAGIMNMADEMKWNSERLHQQFKRIFSYMAETSYNKENPESKIELTEAERHEFADALAQVSSPKHVVSEVEPSQEPSSKEQPLEPNIKGALQNLTDANAKLDEAEAHADSTEDTIDEAKTNVERAVDDLEGNKLPFKNGGIADNKRPEGFNRLMPVELNTAIYKDRIYKFNKEDGMWNLVKQEIPNNYKGKIHEQVWDEWTPKQRTHFINDHFKGHHYLDSLIKYVNFDWDDFPDVPIKYTLDSAMLNHVLQGQYKNAGRIENQYAGKSPKEVWDEWNFVQRKHFLLDHSDVIYPIKGTPLAEDLARRAYFALPNEVVEVLIQHFNEGQYAGGGKATDLPIGTIYKLKNGAIYTVISHRTVIDTSLSYESDAKGNPIKGRRIISSNSWLGETPEVIGKTELDSVTKNIGGHTYTYYLSGDKTVDTEMSQLDARWKAFAEHAGKKLRAKYDEQEEHNNHYANAKMVNDWFNDHKSDGGSMASGGGVKAVKEPMFQVGDMVIMEHPTGHHSEATKGQKGVVKKIKQSELSAIKGRWVLTFDGDPTEYLQERFKKESYGGSTKPETSNLKPETKIRMTPEKKKLEEKIKKLERALEGNKMSAKAKGKLEKQLEEYREKFNRRIPVYERMMESKGKFHIEIPAEYRLKMNTLLHGTGLKPRLNELDGKLRITVDSKAKLNRLYKIYSDMLTKKKQPVPSLDEISGKPSKVKMQK